jgi:phosphocarrier protein
MNGETLRRTVTITNPQGLHMRPITAFVEMASRFQSQVFLSKEPGQRINGKSPLALLGLAAEQGTQLTLEISGPDEQAALEALVEFLANVRTQEDS